MDQFLPDYLRQAQSQASLAFVLVKNDSVLFTKGYGFADAEKKTPVIPDRTLFFAASVSKLLTATAVMQMIEQGKLKEKADVNTYLKRFQLERNYTAPVTVADLLTHTGGIDDSFIVSSVDRPADLVSLGDFFAKHPPRRARPPGEKIVYSNWGMAFAGYLVEAVSGISFYDYVERNIFHPLEMEHSSFRRPIPTNLAPFVATAGLAGQPPDKTAVQLYPSEALVSTVTDMGNFLIAQLNDGKFRGRRVLSEGSVREMHRQHFSQHPHMPGVAYGFFESYINDRRALFHTGGGGHESILYMLPDEHVGFYLVYSGELEQNFVQAFLDHYYPLSHPFRLPAAPADFGQRAGQFTGLYRPDFIASRTIEKLAGLAADTRVSLKADRSLSVGLPPLASQKLRFVEVEPLLFRSKDGFYATFAKDSSDRTAAMFISGSTKDPAAYDKLRWYESGLLNGALVVAGFLIFLSFPIVSMIGFFRQRHRNERSKGHRPLGRLRFAWSTALAVSLLVLLSPTPVLAWVLFGDHSRPSQFKVVLPISISALVLASLLALTLPVFSYLAWRSNAWSVARRIYFSIVAVAGCLMIPVLNYWNLIGL